MVLEIQIYILLLHSAFPKALVFLEERLVYIQLMPDGSCLALNPLELLNKQFFKSFLYFKIFNKKLKNRMIEYCRNNPHIIYFILCIGTWPVELEIVVDDNKQFYSVMDDVQANFPELKSYDFVIFPKEFKHDWIPMCYKSEN